MLNYWTSCANKSPVWSSISTSLLQYWKLAWSIADVTVSDLKRLADRKPLPLENDELLNWNAVKQLTAYNIFSTFVSQNADGDSTKQQSTLHCVYSPDWFWRFSYFPNRQPDLLWVPSSVFQSGFLGTVGFREGMPEVMRNANKILYILYVSFVSFLNLFL